MKPDLPVDVLAHEIAGEKATALGRAGRRLEAALAALATGVDRAAALAEARDALWTFLVQREAMGLRDHRAVLRDFRVPAEVHLGMGARPARR